jgi:uncharacterized membrane protein
MNFSKLSDYLKLDRKEFLFQFQSHPNYPSALAFSDTLNFLGVKNEAYNLEKEYWEELPEEYITVYNNNFSLLAKEEQGFKVFSDDVKFISKEELYKNSDNFILLFDAEDNTKAKEKFNYKYVVFVILGFILIYSVIFLKWYDTLFNLLSVAGLYVSLELFNKKFGQESVVLNNICGARPDKPKENCSKIIDSDKINIFGLKLSDFSMIYFISILLLGVAIPTSSLVLKIITSISSLIIFYSLYVQIFVEKTFCKICLLIVSILILQIALSEIYFSNSFSLNILFISFLVFSVVFGSLIFVNNLLFEKDVLMKSNLKNLRFKRNYDLFKRELVNKEKINFKDNLSGFFIGSKNSKLHISVVSNPYCGYCKDAHEILEKLNKKYPDDISFQIRFNYARRQEDENLDLLMQSLFCIYSKNEKEFLNAMHFWFEIKDLKLFTDKFKNDETKDLSVLKELTEDNLENNLNFTPVFIINGYQFPDKYEREDIFYFIDELLEDEEI